MKGMKLELLGLGIILSGIAFSMNNFWGTLFGLLGMVFVLLGYFRNENDCGEGMG